MFSVGSWQWNSSSVVIVYIPFDSDFLDFSLELSLELSFCVFCLGFPLLLVAWTHAFHASVFPQ